jgi:hypothetical protein
MVKRPATRSTVARNHDLSVVKVEPPFGKGREGKPNDGERPSPRCTVTHDLDQMFESPFTMIGESEHCEQW